MADHPSAAGGAFRRPFLEQVAFFRQKMGNRVPTRRWDDLTGAAHDHAFMVAGAQKADLLADLAAAVDRAIAEGTSLEAFRRDFNAAVERHDWHGWTGESTSGGRAWRTRTIYRVNAYVSYAAGRRAQLQADDWAFWVYLHGGSKHPRPEHLHQFNGLYLTPTDDFWDKHYPPSDWGCSCYVVGARSVRGAIRLGGTKTKADLPAGWNTPEPATGEPPGIGRGWGYAPGASVAGPVAAAAAKIGKWDVQVAKAFARDLPPEQRDAVSEAYRRLPSTADDLRRYAHRVMERDTAGRDDGTEVEGATAFAVSPLKTMGMLTQTDIERVQSALDSAPARLRQQLLRYRALDGYDFSVDREHVVHVWNGHGVGNETRRDHRAVEDFDYARLLLILLDPDAVAWSGMSDREKPVLEWRKRFDNEIHVVQFVIESARRRTLALSTMFIRVVPDRQG